MAGSFLTVKVSGLSPEAITQELARLGKGGQAIAKRVLAATTQEMAAAAKLLAPIGGPEDPTRGALRERIRATRPSARKDGTVIASVVATRSIIQHEDLTFKHPHGGGPKFIERAVLPRLSKVETGLLAELDRMAEGG